MPLPYENATSGEKALGEIQKILRGFGCAKFDRGRVSSTSWKSGAPTSPRCPRSMSAWA